MKKQTHPAWYLSPFPLTDYRSRIPQAYLNRQRRETRKGWDCLIRIADSATWFCSLTTLMFYYRGNIPPRIRRPLFRLRSPTRSQSFSVAVPSAAVRVNQWPRSQKSPQTLYALFLLFDAIFHSSLPRRASKPNNP